CDSFIGQFIEKMFDSLFPRSFSYHMTKHVENYRTLFSKLAQASNSLAAEFLSGVVLRRES
ncbi:hypothetical protein PFISCL1PPCAC_2168, partial [Pristionchus fissidentatus]